MSNPSPIVPDQTRLSEPMATRLLARASELDQLHAAGSAVGDLRAAATAAGIAGAAFDAALAELHSRPPALASDPRARARRWARLVITTAGLAALAAVAALAITARSARHADLGASSARMLDEAIVLQCLAPAEAAELIRPLLTLPANQVLVHATQAPRVLTLRATADQLAHVKARLAPYEVTDAPTCRMRSAQ